MKQTLLLVFLFAGAFSIRVKAETEPNDTKSQANVLPLKGSISGGIYPSTDADWFSVTTTSDGKLSFSITSTNGKNVRVILYDHDGITQLNGTVTAASASFTNDGLAKGTYYLLVTTYYGGETPGYSISNTFVTSPVNNDAEPDSSRATAITLPLNGSKTGHIGYYYNGHRDGMDFYKVTTVSDGMLRIKLTSKNGSNVQAILYDNDASTQLSNITTAGTGYIQMDGLAAGTYFIQVSSYYYTEFEPYTISDSLFNPQQLNDAEPDSSRATAIRLSLDSSKTGHVGYYYKGHRDAMDFYKITTGADGWLQIKIASNNGRNVQAILYDNDATTQLGSTATAGTGYINTYDLAAGTYYVQVNSYYYTDFEPYTITDSLYLFGVPNDPEPDSTKATALRLEQNSSADGHVGYYYNHHRDTADFYKLTTTQDGMIRLFLTSYTGNYMQATLYDNDGTTYLNTLVTPGVNHLDVDGLAAGTYYIKINTYYGGQYSPYTIGDSLYTYYYYNDDEPNDRPYLAKTIAANSMVTGHEDFYYNGQRNPIDYWKINYTGTGNLKLTYSLAPNLLDGNMRYTSFQVYKDTTAGPISSVVTANATTTATLSSLTPGYYYIKVSTYYGNDFEAYAIEPEFDQASVAKIKITSYDTVASCSGNKITVSISSGQAPYTVYLDRFNTLYSAVTTSNKKVTFNNLPDGSYYAVIYADGASGAAYGKSKTVIMEPLVENLTATNIGASKATLHWNQASCAAYYSIRYSVNGSNVWSTKKTNGNVSSFVLSGLQPNTVYKWTIAAVDSANGITATGTYADTVYLQTTASLMASSVDNSMATHNNISMLQVSPNPVASSFVIHYNYAGAQKVNAVLYNANGKAVWSSGLLNADALNGRQVNVAAFGNGIYYLKATTEKGDATVSTKVIVSK